MCWARLVVRGIGSGGLERAGFGRDGLGWFGWVGPCLLGWVGLGPAGLRSALATWTRLGWVGLVLAGLGCN